MTHPSLTRRERRTLRRLEARTAREDPILELRLGISPSGWRGAFVRIRRGLAGTCALARMLVDRPGVLRRAGRLINDPRALRPAIGVVYLLAVVGLALRGDVGVFVVVALVPAAYWCGTTVARRGARASRTRSNGGRTTARTGE